MKIVNEPIPFRTINKVKALAKIINPENTSGQIKNHEEKMLKTDYGNYFPIKENKKKYFLSNVDIRDTYMFDIMFFNGSQIGYLVAIEVNTRKAYAESLNLTVKASDDEINYKIGKEIKTTKQMLYTIGNIFTKIENDGRKINKFLMDGEPAVKGNIIQEFLKKLKIKYKMLTNHNATGKIDRFIRTLRDMIYTLGWNSEEIGIEQMDYLIKFYNDAPHRGLKKWLKVDISPNQMTYEIEDLLIQKVMWDNIQIKKNGLIPVGTKVIVYDPNNEDYLNVKKGIMDKRRRRTIPGNWYVTRNNRFNYEIEDKDTEVLLYVPRWMIDWY